MVGPHQHHFHARSCQNFQQKFSVFLVQVDIVQKLLTLQKQIIPHLKALISGYLDFEGWLCSFDSPFLRCKFVL